MAEQLSATRLDRNRQGARFHRQLVRELLRRSRGESEPVRQGKKGGAAMVQDRDPLPVPAAPDPSPGEESDRQELLTRLREVNERLLLASLREQEQAERDRQ